MQQIILIFLSSGIKFNTKVISYMHCFYIYHNNLIIANKEKQKRHLACMMAYGKEMPPTPREQGIMPRPRRQKQLNNNEDPVKESKYQI
jgi:hypothetical protein